MKGFRPDGLLATGLVAAYWTAVARLDIHVVMLVMAALPVLAAGLVAFVVRRRRRALAIVGAGVTLPPAAICILLVTVEPATEHAPTCGVGFVLALFWLAASVAQVIAMAVLAVALFGLRKEAPVAVTAV